MPYKNYLEVERETEKQLYRICKELETFGKSVTIDTGTDEWLSSSRTLGRRGSNLIEKKPPLLYPPARTKDNRKHSIGLVQIPNNVIVEEKKGNKKSFFLFRFK